MPRQRHSKEDDRGISHEVPRPLAVLLLIGLSKDDSVFKLLWGPFVPKDRIIEEIDRWIDVKHRTPSKKELLEFKKRLEEGIETRKRRRPRKPKR